MNREEKELRESIARFERERDIAEDRLLKAKHTLKFYLLKPVGVK